jgi:hypothetical protein
MTVSSGAPDYLVYQVVIGQPRRLWPVIGRASVMPKGRVHITFNKTPSQAVWLVPLWSGLMSGKCAWNRPPDYVARSATPEGHLSDPDQVGQGWDQSGGAIYLKLSHCPGPAALLRRKVRYRPNAASQTHRGSRHLQW